MTHPDLLGQLSGLQTMMADLLTGVPAAAANARFHPRLASLGWYLGHSVYRELYWLREVLGGDGDLAGRVRHLFAVGAAEAPVEHLPPRDHLLAWAAEIQDEHLRRLATPGALPASPLLADDRLAWFLLQERARDYEAMLWLLLARRLQEAAEAEAQARPDASPAPNAVTSQVAPSRHESSAPPPTPSSVSSAFSSSSVTSSPSPTSPASSIFSGVPSSSTVSGVPAASTSPASPPLGLEPCMPSAEAVLVTQGHYRVGSRGEPYAYECELPPQAVELANFRIARRPVTNAEYLGFMTAGGYARPEFWDPAGQDWLRTGQAHGQAPVHGHDQDRAQAPSRAQAPWHWRRSDRGDWQAIGLNGPVPLGPADPVAGLSRHEARAFAAWAASLGGDLTGAVVQHEYQWEVAARAGLIEGTGRVWEWCANPFHPYPDFSPFPDPAHSRTAFDAGLGVLRGASLHTQRCLRRASFRHPADPADRFRISGLRLVFPPA